MNSYCDKGVETPSNIKHEPLLFSIITPVFNAERYLSKMIESILEQSYFNFELILVDDCSSDDSYKVMEGYKEKDSRVRVIQQTVNVGVSEARNIGIQNATGDWLLFWDADDWVMQDALESYANCIQKYDPDLSVFGVNETYFDNSDEILCQNLIIPRGGYFKTNKEIFTNILSLEEKTLAGYCHNKLYRSSIIKNNNIKFRTMNMNEDLEFNLDYFHHVHTMLVVNRTWYNYRIRPSGSLTGKYVGDFYAIHERKIERYLDLYQSCSPELYETARKTMGPIYGRYVLSSISRLNDPRSGMNLSQKMKEVDRIFSSLTFEKLSDVTLPDGLKLKMVYLPVHKKWRSLSLTEGWTIYLCKRHLNSLFVRLKSLRAQTISKS